MLLPNFRQSHRLLCTAHKTEQTSRSPILTTASHSIHCWKLLLFFLCLSTASASLTHDACLHASVNSHPPTRSTSSYSYIFLVGLALLTSESFHLTKSPLVRVSLVSLNLCQGLFHMSKHFNDIWCWNLGEGEREHHSDRRKKISLRKQTKC